MVYSLAVRARGLEYGGREFESQSMHFKPEAKGGLYTEFPPGLRCLPDFSSRGLH